MNILSKIIHLIIPIKIKVPLQEYTASSKNISVPLVSRGFADFAVPQFLLLSSLCSQLTFTFWRAAAAGAAGRPLRSQLGPPPWYPRIK